MGVAGQVWLFPGDGLAAPNTCCIARGKPSVDGDGNPLHAGDFSKQILRAIDNLEQVLSKAELKLSDVVRLNHCVTFG